MTLKTSDLNEYAAAELTGMSPRLLAWLNKYAPKQGETRKLKVAREVQGAKFYSKDELLDFDVYLRKPWPSVAGKRPNIPAGIKEEIKIEANNQCAICSSHSDSCEAAHIVPVSKTHSNHPSNLIWLCASHHTEYDKGVLGPLEEDLEFIPSFKTTLLYYKRLLWSTQGNICHRLFLVLDACSGLEAKRTSAKTPNQKKAVESLAKQMLGDLSSLAPVSKGDPNYPKWQKLEKEAKALSTNKDSVAKRLKKAQVIRDEFVAASGHIVCPVCLGSGAREGEDCPACAGEREIPKDLANRIDFDDFKKVDCPVCDGEGIFRGEDCPGCQGEAHIDKRFADKMDTNDFAFVDCPLCDGEGAWGGDDCPVCHGDRQIEKRHIEQIDLRDYKEVDCPVCKGKGRHLGNDCLACRGNRTMLRHEADSIELRDYVLVDCPACLGVAKRYDDCRCCGGELKMMRCQADQVDVSEFRD